jgi:hypothetical protein
MSPSRRTTYGASPWPRSSIRARCSGASLEHQFDARLAHSSHARNRSWGLTSRIQRTPRRRNENAPGQGGASGDSTMQLIMLHSLHGCKAAVRLHSVARDQTRPSPLRALFPLVRADRSTPGSRRARVDRLPRGETIPLGRQRRCASGGDPAWRRDACAASFVEEMAQLREPIRGTIARGIQLEYILRGIRMHGACRLDVPTRPPTESVAGVDRPGRQCTRHLAGRICREASSPDSPALLAAREWSAPVTVEFQTNCHGGST